MHRARVKYQGSRAIYWAVHFFIWPSSLIGPDISFLMLFLFGTRASTRLVACTCMLHARIFFSLFLFFLLHAQIYIIFLFGFVTNFLLFIFTIHLQCSGRYFFFIYFLRCLFFISSNIFIHYSLFFYRLRL